MSDAVLVFVVGILVISLPIIFIVLRFHNELINNLSVNLSDTIRSPPYEPKANKAGAKENTKDASRKGSRTKASQVRKYRRARKG